MFRFIHRITTSRKFWFLGLLVIVAALCFALVLQEYYGMSLCYYCSRARFYYSLMALACLIGMIAPQYRIMRTFAIIILCFATIVNILNAYEHLAYLHGESFARTCPVVADIPLNLEQRFPLLYKIQGICGSNDQFHGYKISDLNYYFLIAWSVVCGLVLLAQLTKLKQPVRRMFIK